MNKIPMPVIIVVAVVAILAAVYMGVSSSQPKEYRPDAKPLVNDDTTWLREVAKRTGGDVKKLTPEERKRADKITRGFTEMALSAMAKEGS